MKRLKTSERLPPHSVEQEALVIGCCLEFPNEAMPECLAAFGGRNPFYDIRHQTLWTGLRVIWDSGHGLDTALLVQWLTDCEMLDKVGGFPYVSSLPARVSSVLNLGDYAGIVVEKWRLRQLILACTDTIEKAMALDRPAESLISEVQDAVFNLPQAEDAGGRQIGAYADQIEQRLERYARGIGMITGLPTGFRTLDRWVSGLHPGEVWVLGGDPGSGKTSFAMNIAERVAVNGGSPVGIISLEMSAEDLVLRLICSKTRSNFHKVRTGGATKEELAVLKDCIPMVRDAKQSPIYVDDSSGLTLYDIRSRLRVMKRRFGIKFAIVDYLQLTALTKEQMFLGMAAGYADVARGLQQSAKELQIPIMVLSQLNNEARKRKKGDKPRLTDFRETGAIGDVANFAGILWRTPLPDDEEEALWKRVREEPMGEHVLPMQLEIVKSKNGPSGVGLEFSFHRWCMRFVDPQDPKYQQ